MEGICCEYLKKPVGWSGASYHAGTLQWPKGCFKSEAGLARQSEFFSNLISDQRVGKPVNEVCFESLTNPHSRQMFLAIVSLPVIYQSPVPLRPPILNFVRCF